MRETKFDGKSTCYILPLDTGRLALGPIYIWAYQFPYQIWISLDKLMKQLT